MAVKSLDLVWIVVADLQRAVRYYTEIVGLQVDSIDINFGWAELSGVDGGAVLGIAQKNDQDNMEPGSNGVIALNVDDLVATKAEMVKKGNVTFIGDIMEIPGHVKLQTCEDIDGNRFQLAEQL